MNTKQMWEYYGLAAILLILYTVIGKPQGNTTRNLWVGYMLLGAALGIMNR